MPLFFRNVSWKTKYTIEFKGLKEGRHDFGFEIDNAFFAHFEDSLVDNGEIMAKVFFEKRSTFMKLVIDHKGWLELTCDRCLELYRQPVENSTELFVKFGEEAEDDGENIIWISPEDHQINLAQIFYEYIILSIPLRHIHPKNKDGIRGCNPEMIEKLKKYKHADKDQGNEPDVRWDVLKNMRNNN